MSAMVPPDRHNLEVEVEEAFVLYGAQQHANFPQVAVSLLPDDGSSPEEGRTGEEGKVTFQLAPGDYTVQPRREGFTFHQTAVKVESQERGRKKSESALMAVAAVRKTSAAWMLRAKSREEGREAPRTQNEIRVSVQAGNVTRLRLVGLYDHDPLPDDWFTSDGSEQKAVSEMTYDSCLEKLYQALKIVTLLVVFLLTLAAGVFSRGTTFFMVSQLSARSREVCSAQHPETREELGTSVANTALERVAWIWCIFFAFAFPEVLHFLKSLNSCLSKNVGLVIFLSKFLSWRYLLSFLTIALLDGCHVLGLAILFLHALPRLDSTTAVLLTSGVCCCPSILQIVGDIRRGAKIKAGLSLLALLSLIGAMILLVWLVLEAEASWWSAPLGLFLTSLGWWKNFSGRKSLGWLHALRKMVEDEKTRFILDMILALWKILVFFGCISVIPKLAGSVPSYEYIFTNFRESFLVDQHMITDPAVPGLATSRTRHYEEFLATPWFLLILQVASTLFTYTSGRFACKLGNIRIRLGVCCFDTGNSFAFAAPCLALVTPATVAVLVALCHYRTSDPCSLPVFPSFLFFSCPSEPLEWPALLVGGLLFLSYMWVTSHTWSATGEVLASELQIFGCNFYSGLLVDQAMMLCRSRGDDEDNEIEEKMKEKTDVEDVGPSCSSLDKTIRIKGCATMWHENSEEIKVMLKSVFKIDDDFYARRKALDLLPDKDYHGKPFLSLEKKKKDEVQFFEWETHIFFDDCMAKPEAGKADNVNDYVKDLIGAVDEYGKQWYGKHRLKIPEVTKYVTPYGGRLVWSLPGGTSITCHLKDKKKIRVKKRWSQIMYMYYFLGHQLKGNHELKTEEERKNRAMNTFILALDGDVDFLPDAITKVVDLMKRNPRIGAACGRIHPTGSGYMQSYQKFEYAIGHWLQKATEHMLGCVLCSPGCFSLFRAAAMMDENVMHTYKSIAKEPKHHVQYDQGEDRWLCTLMLKQGWRVEYSAASDSFTACPEGFKEFYNQRRRWMPSTLLNIADLIADYKQVVEKNDDISLLYILYQGVMMVGTVIGPGSIVLMLIGAFSLAFGFTNEESLIFNTVLVGIFILACMFAKADHQIRLAELLTVLYAIIMIAVYIGVAIQIIDDGPLSLSAIGIWVTFGSFILAALLHPQEFGCLFSCIIYLCTIPSMYLLLVIYAFFNMDNQGWGTREGPKVAVVGPEAKVTPKSLLSFGKSWLTTRLAKATGQEPAVEAAPAPPLPAPKQSPPAPEKTKQLVDESTMAQRFVLDDGQQKSFDKDEEVFWRKMINQTAYLKPLEYSKEEKKKIADGLFELKNKYALGFVLVNAMWVSAIYMLQANQDQLNLPWPLGAKVLGLSWGSGVGEDMNIINVNMEYLKLEPVGAVFMIMFIFIMFIQFAGMLQHRLMTLSHIVASTNKNFNAKDPNLQNRGLTDSDSKFLDKVDNELESGGPTGQGPTGQGPTGKGPNGQGPTGQGPSGQGTTGQGPPAGQGKGVKAIRLGDEEAGRFNSIEEISQL